MISALVLGIVLFAGLVVPAEAKDKQGKKWDRRDNGRHLGWTRGRHRGWRNRNRFDDRDRFERRRRAARRDFRIRGDRVGFIGRRSRDFNREQRLESRRFRAQQRVERRAFRRNRF